MNSIELSGDLVVVTGAGISLASGIPTFRGKDPGAIWTTDVMTLATLEFFETNPVEFWQWYLTKFGDILSKKPNAAHFSLADLEESYSGSFTLITQNVDTLHEQAGSKPLKVHGSADRVRCTSFGCRFSAPRGLLPYNPEDDIRTFLADPCLELIPKCSACKSVLRPHVLLFDEFYLDHLNYKFDAAIKAAKEAETILFVGTSFAVSITDLVLGAGRKSKAKMYSIDPHHSPPLDVEWIQEKAEDFLPTIVPIRPTT